MKWTARKKWNELKKGVNCPMCDDMHLTENKFSFLVSELKQSFVRLPKNQYQKGYTVVILKKHANDLFELNKKELSEFWQDIALVAKAMDKTYKPAKIDYCIFGHHCPHLHCHLIIQSFKNDPSKTVKIDEKKVLLTNKEYLRMIFKMQREIDKIKLKS
jgi:diadenosine tetraphosphate (Ap4A) HIT family hydrolase